MTTLKPADMDSYIASFPKDVQKMLQQVRSAIKKAAPKAEETIKYTIPTFTLNGNMLSFAAYKKHIGVYPAPKGTASFQKELAPYKKAKATIQFPLDKPIPLQLLTSLVKYRMKEMLAKSKTK